MIFLKTIDVAVADYDVQKYNFDHVIMIHLMLNYALFVAVDNHQFPLLHYYNIVDAVDVAADAADDDDDVTMNDCT